MPLGFLKETKKFFRKKIFGSLGNKLIIFISFFLVTIFVVAAFILIDSNKNNLERELISRSESFAQLAARPIIEGYQLYFKSGYFKFRESINKTLRLNADVYKIQILDPEGNILVDSDFLQDALVFKDYELKKERAPQHIRELLGSSALVHIKDKKSGRTTEIFYPYFDDWGAQTYSLRYFISYQNVDEAIQGIKKQIILLTVFSLLIVLFLIQKGVNKAIIFPIKDLQDEISNISQSRLHKRIRIKTGDEIEELSEAFNQMIGDLERSYSNLEESKDTLEIKVNARTKELRELAEGLEEQVKKRTIELQKRVNELEKFHRLTVGRELKMVELKKKIKKFYEK